MNDTQKPKWWNDIPDRNTISLTKKELLEIIDGAVSEGRCSFDLYYGSNNDFHTAQIINGSPEWKGRFA